jgi:type III restriction enzyme
VPVAKKDDLVNKINHQNYVIQRANSPALRGEKFVPIAQLCVMEQGKLVLLEPEILIDRAQWDLSKCLPNLQGFEIKDGQAYVMDMDEGTQTLRTATTDRVQTQLTFANTDATLNDLIYTLEEHLQSDDITPAQMAVYLKNVLTHLIEDLKIELATLLIYTRALKLALQNQIKAHRADQVSAVGAQLLLSDDAEKQIVVSPEYQFEFKVDRYPVRVAYEGYYKFNNHHYPVIDSLKDHGEEFECAKEIDQHPKIKKWIRNLVKSEFAFSLTMHDGGHMYPDFVCQLTDNRILLIEYKGDHLLGSPKTNNKKTICELWARKTENRFLLACDPKNANGRSITRQIDDAIGG